MRPSFVFLFATLWALPLAGNAQIPAGAEFQITRITKNLVATPDYGIGQYRSVASAPWLEVEAEFVAKPLWTDELTFKYYVLFNGRLLTGEVSHVNIAAGLNRSVMYVLPVALQRFSGDRPLLATMFQNIAIQIMQGGALKAESNLAAASPKWFSKLPALPGFLLNKNETPFAPLSWDRYAQVKTSSH
jgi:hypothetical protein